MAGVGPDETDKPSTTRHFDHTFESSGYDVQECNALCLDEEPGDTTPMEKKTRDPGPPPREGQQTDGQLIFAPAARPPTPDLADMPAQVPTTHQAE